MAEINYHQTVSSGNNGTVFGRVYSDLYQFEQVNPGFYWADGARSWGAELRYSWNLSSRLSVVTGGEYLSLYGVISGNPDRFGLTSFYLQANAELGDSVRLVAGVREDDYSTFGRAWSPRAGLIWAPSRLSTLKLLYGTAFRAPMTWELQGNPSLGPERMKTYELVWERQLRRQSRLVTSLFVDDMFDLIDTETFYYFANYGRVRSRGLEVQIESRLPSGTAGHLGLAAVRAQDVRSGEWLTNSPRLVASGGISMPLRASGLCLSADVQYLSRRLDRLGGSVSPRAVANIVLRSTRPSAKGDLSLGLYNILGTEYVDPGFESGNPVHVPQTGRKVLLQANYLL